MNKPRHRQTLVNTTQPKTWQEIVKAWSVTMPQPATSPNTLAIRQSRDYTKTGKPTQKFLRRLTAALPPKKAKRGMGRANLRRMVRQQAVGEERISISREAA